MQRPVHCGAPVLLIDADGVERDANGLITAVQMATTLERRA